MHEFLIIAGVGFVILQIANPLIRWATNFIASCSSDSQIQQLLINYVGPAISTIVFVIFEALVIDWTRFGTLGMIISSMIIAWVIILIWDIDFNQTTEDSESKPYNLLDDLANYHLPVAAFKLSSGMTGGIYPNEIVDALQLFYSHPCPETALVLVKTPKDTESANPFLGLITTCDHDYLEKPFNGKKGNRTIPSDKGIDEYVESVEKRMMDLDSIYAYLIHQCSKGKMSIGFHRMRDQKILLDRISLLGLRPSIFDDKRKWLREKFMTNMSCWLICMDFICIWGNDLTNVEEKFWQANGQEVDAQWHLASEVQCRFNDDANEFAIFLNTLDIED